MELNSNLQQLASSCKNSLNDGKFDGTFLTKVLSIKDPRATSTEMNEAITKEVKRLMDARTFQIILREEISVYASILPGRFVLAINSTKSG